MYYKRKNSESNYEDDLGNLNNKIDIIYSLLDDILQDRNDLLVLFNSRINYNIKDENTFNDDIYVDSDGRYKPIFTCTVVSHIYTYDRAQNIINFVQPLQKLIV